MTFPNWTDMQFYHYLIVAGAAIVVFALVLYFTPISRLKVPAILMGIAGGLGTGVALGVIAMGTLGFQFKSSEVTASEQRPSGAGMRRGGLGGGGRGMGSGRGERSSSFNYKDQLASFITKLDLLSRDDGLKVTMDAEQKRKLRVQIQNLDGRETLSDDEARAKLEAMLVILTEAQRRALREAGANLAEQEGGSRNGEAPANPFKEGQASQHLKSLRERMDEKKPK